MTIKQYIKQAFVTLLILLAIATLLYGATINGFVDFVIRATPSNPSSGNARLYIDSGTNLLTCLLSSGISCMPTTFLPAAGASTTYYIATATGSDSNPCTSGSKCKTFAHVLGLIAGLVGQAYTINAADGTYSEPIPIQGYGSSQKITIIGNTTTPANVIVNGTTTCVVSDGSTGYSATVCNVNGWLSLSGMTITAASGQGRALFTMDNGHTIISKVVLNCPSMANSSLGCVETALASTLEINSPTTINLTGSTASGIGIEVNQGSEAIFYGDSSNGALTVAGPNANTDTLTGIQVHRRGLFDMHMITANQSSTVSITGVNIGALVVGGTWMQHNTGSANPQVTISHSSGTVGTGVYVESGFWFSNVGGLQMTNLATGLQTDSSGSIVQKSCGYTNVTTHISGTSFAPTCF